MALYSNTSPWYNTPVSSQQYLDIMEVRTLTPELDDYLYKLEPQYMHRPDLLAYDLYDTPKLWWVFARRNADVLKDPVYDMVPGVEIYLPKKSSLLRDLGL